MAELNLFTYIPGSSILHKLHPGIKLLCLLILGFSSAFTGGKGTAALISLCIILMYSSGLPLKTIFSELKTFWFIIFFFSLAAAFSLEESIKISTVKLPFSPEGIYSGLIFAGRFVFLISAGLLISSTSTILELRNAAFSILKKTPFINAEKTAVFLMLTLSMLPLLFRTADEQKEAGLSRCLASSGNIFRRIKTLALPLLVSSFLKADEFTEALEARGLEYKINIPQNKPAPKDISALVLCSVFSFIIIFCK